MNSTHGAGVVMKLEVSLDLAGLLGLAGFAVGLGFTQVSGVEFVDEGLVGGLGEHALFLKDGQQTHGLLNEIDGGLQVHTCRGVIEMGGCRGLVELSVIDKFINDC